MNNLLRTIAQFKSKKVLVVGDIMADKYLWGEVDRISPEAPVQIVKISRESIFPGGAANLANNVVALGGKADLIGTLGQDQTGKDLLPILEKRKIGTEGIIFDYHKPTVTKTRVLSGSQQLIRLDFENTESIGSEKEEALLNSMQMLIEEADIVVFSDYDKGTLTKSLIQKMVRLARENTKIIIADTKAAHYSLYQGVDLITPNHEEASRMSGATCKTDRDVINTGLKLSKQMQCNVLITRGSEGMSLFEKNGGALHFPTEAKEVFDVSGAGDTVAAAISLAIACGASYKDAAIIANQAAAIGVSKAGTATVSQKEIMRKFEIEQTKTKTLQEIVPILSRLKADGKTIVFTSGCFDLLHPGHIKLLKKASEYGDILVVGLNTDASVKQIKGDERPVIDQNQRAEMLSFLEFVDFVTFFNENTPEQILGSIKPDIFVKGGDYKIEDLPEAKVVQAYGGKIKLVPFIEGYSSSRIINKILNPNIETLNKS